MKCHSPGCPDEGNLGYLNPPPNRFCKYHFVEVWNTEHPEELADDLIQKLVRYAINQGDDRFRKFLIDET